jgi:hypothetical protein
VLFVVDRLSSLLRARPSNWNLLFHGSVVVPLEFTRSVLGGRDRPISPTQEAFKIEVPPLK